MRTKLSITGIIAAIFGFLAIPFAWMTYKNNSVTVILYEGKFTAMESAGYGISNTPVYGYFAGLGLLFLIGSIIMIIFLNLYETDENQKSNRIIRNNIVIGTIGVLLNLLAFILFFTNFTKWNQNISLQLGSNIYTTAVGSGMIFAILSICLGIFSIITCFIRNRFFSKFFISIPYTIEINNIRAETQNS